MLQTFSLPEAMLDTLVAEHWGKRPGVWRSPSAAAFATPEDIIASLLTARTRLEAGDAKFAPLVFTDARPTGFELSVHLPMEGESLRDWERRLCDWAKNAELGMLVQHAQALDWKVFENAMKVARAVYRRRGMSAGGAWCEIFYGNYSRSFVHLHKDILETLTFVVEGRKRFLVWPYEVFADQTEIADGGDALEISLGRDFDYEPYRESAIVLEGGPGDVLFWPASYWHVAEAVDARFVSTVTVSFFPNTTASTGCPFRMTNEALTRFGADGVISRDPPLPAPTDRASARAVVDGIDANLRRHLANPTVERARREFALRWATAQGFGRLPEEDDAAELDETNVIEVDPENPLLWLDANGDDEVTASVNGLVVTALPKFLPLFEHLNRGGRFAVRDLLDRFGGAPLGEDDLHAALGALGGVHYFRIV